MRCCPCVCCFYFLNYCQRVLCIFRMNLCMIKMQFAKYNLQFFYACFFFNIIGQRMNKFFREEIDFSKTFIIRNQTFFKCFYHFLTPQDHKIRGPVVTSLTWATLYKYVKYWSPVLAPSYPWVIKISTH